MSKICVEKSQRIEKKIKDGKSCLKKEVKNECNVKLRYSYSYPRDPFEESTQ